MAGAPQLSVDGRARQCGDQRRDSGGGQALTSTPGSPGVLLQGVLSILLLSLVVGAGTAGDTLVGGRRLELADPVRPPGCDLGDLEVAGPVVLDDFLAKSGEALAEQTGLGTSFFGAALLGLSTSLPEQRTVLAAVRLKPHTVAIARVFGTNPFNVTIIVLVDALHPGDPVLVEAGRFASFGALLAIVLTAVFLVGTIERRDRTVLRMGIDSRIAIACHVGAWPSCISFAEHRSGPRCRHC